ncbi:energy-coupling factor transporter transmembrane component T family protein [Microvirga guangxiensis]|uniref:Energy-coupling factor transport system permease protein n=1 Tax=Microvirga guangxiensis TaxID=549386 RepID=A0A1G5KET1_9HYPH|nr:energy-coupling factor transporter transmembrane component T [Microvirga guangxiensis]SCY99113.1 energy-coupling factor transport system permease protein [Microvirga guangxiensis]
MAATGRVMLKALNPLSKLLVCVVGLAASVLVFDARFQIALIVLTGFSLVILNRTSPLLLLALMVPFCLFGFGFLTTSLLFRQDSDFAMRMAGEALLTSPAFSAGLTLFLRAVVCGMISVFFALTTDPGALVRALMVHARLPPRIGYSLFAAMLLVPDLASEAQQMRIARAMKSGRRIRRVPGPGEIMSLVIPLLAFAIRRAGRTAIALEARGLSPDSPRTVLNAPGFRRSDVVFMIAAILAITLCGAVTFTDINAFLSLPQVGYEEPT